MNNVPLIILSIDPGYDRCGWAIGVKENGEYKNLDFGLIQTVKTKTIFERFSQIRTFLVDLIENYQPKHLAIENLYFSKNATSAMRVAEIRGLIFDLAIANNIEIFEYDPVTVKLAVTGNGKSSKTELIKMVKLLLKNSIKLDLQDDAYDAIGIGITHATIYKKNLGNSQSVMVK